MGTSTYFTAAAPTIAHARQQLDYLLDAPEPANQIARAVATEHSILLSRDQARGLASKAQRQHAPGNLHNLARAALNRITAAGPEFPWPDVHKLDKEFPWRSYVACHAQADDIIGCGIVRAEAEFIASTTDPNRGGQPRLDFVFYRADDSYCRLHPGDRPRNDARPLFFGCRPHTELPASSSGHATELPASSGGHATEQPASAEHQWTALNGRCVTLEFAATVPQIDQMSKKEALHTLQTLPMGPLPTDTHAAFKWWLFVANLGDKRDRVIGTGIIGAVLEDQWEDGVVLLFKRQDGTEVKLEIQQPAHGPCSTRIL